MATCTERRIRASLDGSRDWRLDSVPLRTTNRTVDRPLRKLQAKLGHQHLLCTDGATRSTLKWATIRGPFQQKIQMCDATVDDIYALWDELAGFPASQSDDALNHMLSRLCSIFDAQNAAWAVVVRLPTPPQGDLMNGWRPHLVRVLHHRPTLAASIQTQVEKFWLPKVDISAIIGAAGDEPFLTRLLSEALPSDWFKGEYYRRHYLDVGHADHMSARCTINEDVRIHLFLYRGLSNPRFTVETKAPFTLAIRGLRWFQLQLLLSHGIHAASAPLTPTERSVLLALLAGETEKEIARSLGKRYNTVHSHIKSIYSKFGVRNRPALTALWLGQSMVSGKSKDPLV